jgi:hypothetical protein
VGRLFTFALFLLALPSLAIAQEVRFIDLRGVEQRVLLRTPSRRAAGQGDLSGGSGGGFAVASVADTVPDIHDPRHLQVILLGTNTTDIRPGERFDVEFRILNTGTAALEIPVWPHLSDLQPPDDSAAFDYLSLAVSLGARASPEGPIDGGSTDVELYGSSGDARTLLLLRPGEWIRVYASLKLQPVDHRPRDITLSAGFWMRRNTFQPGQAGSFTRHLNLPIDGTPGPSLAMRLRPLLSSVDIMNGAGEELRQLEPSWLFVRGICDLPPLIDEQEAVTCGTWHSPEARPPQFTVSITVVQAPTENAVSRWVSNREPVPGWTITADVIDRTLVEVAIHQNPYQLEIRFGKGRFVVMVSGWSRAALERVGGVLLRQID